MFRTARRPLRLTGQSPSIQVPRMRTPRLTTAVLALGTCLSAAAADWPQWRGPGRDGHAPAGSAIADKFPANLPAAWTTPVGYGLDSPVVAGGQVFFLAEKDGKEVVHAAAADTGKIRWTAVLDESFKDSQSDPGPRCTAVVDGNHVYAQSCRGTLKCLAVADGQEIWSTRFTADFGATFTGEKGKAEGHTRHGNTGAPVVDGDHLIAGVGGKDATYVCFDKRTGEVVWKCGLEDLLPAYAAPVVASPGGTKQLVAFTTGGVLGIDRAAGKLLWTVPLKTALGRHVTTPVVAGDMVVVGSFNVGLVGIKVAAGGAKAEQAWQTKDAMPNFSSPVLVGGTHVIGVGQGLKLFCADIASGAIAWTADASLGKAHAGLIVVGDKVLALGDNGELVMFAADPRSYRELGRATVALGGKTWCVPAYADGKLFLRDARAVKCIDLLQK